MDGPDRSESRRGAPPEAEQRALVDVARRLGREFAEVPHDVVELVVAQCHGRTADARVQNFRLVLAERSARDRLRRGDVPERAPQSLVGSAAS